jgi:hypothetical protein
MEQFKSARGGRIFGNALPVPLDNPEAILNMTCRLRN